MVSHKYLLAKNTYNNTHEKLWKISKQMIKKLLLSKQYPSLLVLDATVMKRVPRNFPATWCHPILAYLGVRHLKKLERDYQHAYEKYTELQSDWYRYHKGHSGHDIDRAGYFIYHIKNVVEQLQNVLDNLNTEGAPKRRRETSSNGKQFFLKHGCKSLAQEKMILQLKAENKEQYSDDLSQESIDVKRIHEKLSYIQRIIPESSSKKPLLRRVKDIKKMTEKAISDGELVGNRTSHQDNMKNCTSIKVKLLTTAIRDFEKEREERERTLQEKRRIGKGYPEKMRVLKEKYDCIGEERDAEKTNMLDLKKNFMSRHKNASQRHC